MRTVGLTVSVLDLPAVRSLLDGHPESLRCRACGDVLPVPATVQVAGDGWTADVYVDGTGGCPETPAAFVSALGRHLRGVIGALWLAADRADQHQLARERHAEVSAEALAAALLAAEGRLPGWVAGDRTDALGAVDDMLGPPQASALACAALSVVPDDGPELAAVIGRHVAPGLVLPRAVGDLHDATARRLADGRLDGRARLAVLAFHAAAHIAAGQPDPLAAQFTRDWITVAWAVAERPEDPQLRRLQPPADLLARAVDPAELTAAVLQTTDAPPGWIDRLQRIAEQAGRPRLIRQVARNLPVLAQSPAALFREALSELAGAGDEQTLIEALRFLLGALRGAGRTGEMEAMTDHALHISDGSDTSRALLLAQFGAAAKDARMPSAFLEKVGDQAQPWEERLPTNVRLALHTERATALRLAGRPREAQAILAPFLDGPLDAENRWVTELNLAMVLRDSGAADAALRETEDLLARAPDDDARFLALQSLARTTTALGRHADSIEHLRGAISLAVGTHAEHAPVLRASLASLLAAGGDAAGALGELAALGADPLAPQAALGDADATTVLLEQGEELDAEQLEHTTARLRFVLEQARAAGDRTVEASALRVRARLRELLNDDAGASADWESLLEIYRDPLALVSLAALRGIDGRQDDARALLVQIPEALLDEHGGATDLGAIVDATGRVRAGLRQLATVMMAGRPLPSEVRLAAELSRDAIGRVRAWSSAAGSAPSRRAIAGGLPDGALRTLAPTAGSLWVLEWWEGAQGVVSLLTRIAADGAVDMRALPAMPVVAPDVADEILARLQHWWPGRPGDPLDHSGWRKLAEWLRAALGDGDDGDHLVIIEHAGLTGLPWHAVDDATWTTSYAPGWTALLDLPTPTRPIASAGVVTVAARGETDRTLRAFADTADRARIQAARRGVRLNLLDGVAADAAAVLELLRRTDLAVLLCHGMIDPDQLDLALLVAADGQLPSQHPIAASSAHGRAFRLTWRALQEVSAGPAVVLSAACSTGQGMIGGLGERLGLFAALRSRGTRAVVAPAWDAVAADVPAQLGDVLEMLLDGVPLGHAVKRAGDRAAENLPAWRARVLCVDGDWR